MPEPIEFRLTDEEFARLRSVLAPQRMRSGGRFQVALGVFQTALGIGQIALGVSAGAHGDPRESFWVFFGFPYAVLGAFSIVIARAGLRKLRLTHYPGVTHVTFAADGFRLVEATDRFIRWPDVVSVSAYDEAFVVMGRSVPIVAIPRRVLGPNEDVWSYFERQLISTKMLYRPRRFDTIYNGRHPMRAGGKARAGA